ncbi:uncharacterized protein LOC135839385 [Planococcus citri]|uniref:uncharacterized protein LOC135839385 n=1 Tax=Planococcus citri TaxID=170843 RepID=UPI0031F9F89C
MIRRNCIHCSVIRAFIVVLCFENWIFCAPSSLVRDDDLNIDTEDVILDPPPRDPPSSFTSSRPFRRPRRPTQASQSVRPDNSPDGQSFFQSFAPLFNNNSPLGHSRPLLYPDHAFKPSFKTASYRDLPFTGTNDNILGSGNFGVVKGGTYYAEEREDGDFASDSEPYAYIGSSPHHRRKNPPPAFRNGGDFFAHFRDFADITAPSKSFSEYYVVYVNKNATVEESKQPAVKRPKNIIEQLEMLDSADDPLTAKESSKQSKFKRKLNAYQRQNNDKEKSTKSKLYSTVKEVPEPLIALS